MLRIFFLITLFAVFASCQKSNLQNPDTMPVIRPVKSIIVTYPLEQDQYHFKQSYYRFDTDSLTNQLVISGTDSTYSSSILSYQLIRSVKSYYFTQDLPKRVEKITFRRYAQSQYGGADYYDHGNFDLDFIYSDYTSHPSQLRLTLYRDYSGFIVTNQIAGVVPEFSVYFGGPFRDFVNLNDYNLPSRRGSRTESWGGTTRVVFTDTLDELTISNNYYLPVFFNDPQAFPVDSRYVGFQSAFVYNPDQTCKIFAIDLIDNYYLTLFGQRKMDFTYSSDSKSLNDYLPIYNPTDVIFWENIAARYAGLPGASVLAGNYSDAYNYYPDLYSFYQDASTSYTDSLFVVNGTTKQLRNATTYYNRVVLDSLGNISTITKTNQNDSVFRKIEFFY
jgi:hypothetical protein